MSTSASRPRASRARAAALLFAGCALALVVHTAAADAPVTAGSLRELVWVADPQVSADGRRVAFVRTHVDAQADDYASDVWVVEGDAPPRPLTTDPAEDLRPRWSPDGQRLAFVSRRSGKPQIHVLDRDGEPWQLTDVEDGVGGYAWSPDGTRIAFASTTPTPEEKAGLPPEPPSKHAKSPFVTERLRYRMDGTPGWRTPKRQHLWVVRTDAGPKAAATRVTRGDFEHADPQWSKDGTTLYFTSARGADAERRWTDTELWAMPADGSAEPRALTDRRGPDGSPVVSPDGRWIAYLGYDEKAPPASHTRTRLYVLDPRTGERRALAGDLDREIGERAISDMGAPRGDGEGLVWRADSRAIYFVTADLGQGQLHEATLDGRGRALTTLPQGELRAIDVTRDGRVFAVHSGPAQPPELRTFALRDAGRDSAWRAVTDFNAGFAARHALVPYEEFWFEGAAPSITAFPGRPAGARPGADRQWIQGWILKPPGFDAARRYPLVLYIHGGPHAMYGSGFFHEFQLLASAGYVVLITNPRGSTGYGEAFANSVQYRYPGDDHLDLMAGVDALLARGYVDPARMAIGGGSGGGLLTAWTIGKTDRFAAALVERSVVNWHSFVGTADMNLFFAERWFRDFPWRDAADHLARSPLSLVDAVKTPVLVLHNEDDWRTTVDQGLQYYAALRMLDKPAKLAVFPDSSHGMSRNGRPSHRVARLELIVDWFDRHAKNGGRAAPGAAGGAP